jgi:hypothetical protein
LETFNGSFQTDIVLLLEIKPKSPHPIESFLPWDAKNSFFLEKKIQILRGNENEMRVLSRSRFGKLTGAVGWFFGLTD